MGGEGQNGFMLRRMRLVELGELLTSVIEQQHQPGHRFGPGVEKL